VKPLFDDLIDVMKKHRLRISKQRLKILEYLVHNRHHQTVDQIYHELHPDLPTLSKTTVYNTMKALVQAGIVKEIGIDEHETRYDITKEEHGHFKCESCHNVYDFPINIDDGLKKGGLEGYLVNSKNVYLKGICPKCLLDIKLVNTD